MVFPFIRRTRGDRRRGTRGGAFTIVEAVLVMSVIGILAAIALPRYSAFVARERLQSAARRVSADLLLAQRQARLTSATQKIEFFPSAGKYVFANLKDPDRVNSNYEVFLGREPYRATIVSAAFGDDAILVFDGYGYPDSGGAVVLAVGNLRQTVTVENGTGRPRMTQVVTVEAIE